MSRSVSAANGPQHQAVRRTRGLAHGETQLIVQVLEFGGDPAPRHLGEPIERQPQHRFGGGRRCAEMACDRIDRGVVVLGFHDDIEEFVAPFERAHQRVGDLAARNSGILVGHAPSLTTHSRQGPGFRYAGCKLTAMPE